MLGFGDGVIPIRFVTCILFEKDGFGGVKRIFKLFPDASLMSVKTTVASSATNRSMMALPIPVAPPVTMAILSAN
ncbi:hypothetical protein FC96_GL000556 [Secundilactobacillus kimchicus JCM 15530]|uniref:Uncharacterized protein n=1 Tax=Secundilactobacillus kimchicus JCM 15530 TaxID=1302272 RepID=A0A0R1HLA5_9LACO|nr:hypothetical protein FC96_GL000556 [Secundilactobacillus kimchicus JCM 15530]